MPTLYKALISQHARVLQSVRHAEPMTAQLQSFFEQVVLENNLQALIIENLSPRRERSWREVERVRTLGRTARYPFFIVSPEDELNQWFDNGDEILGEEKDEVPILLPSRQSSAAQEERFLIISDAHFSAVLSAVTVKSGGKLQPGRHQIICSCDPDVVYTALEYVQARFTVEHPGYADLLTAAVRESVPKATSLHLTLSVTTKLASLWQEQTGREIAINRIASSIRQSLELDDVLQTAVNEVGTTLSVDCCSLYIEPVNEDENFLTASYFRQPLGDEEQSAWESDLTAYKRRMMSNPKAYIRDGLVDAQSHSASWYDKPTVVVPLVFLSQFVGILFVRSEETARIWQENEILLLQTVADQVAIAVNHSRLYVKSQREALCDDLTGIFNRRFFEMQFERDLSAAQRTNQSLSLILVDLDNFKNINDRFGHSVGDDVLRCAARVMKNCLRNYDTLARYGGEEFAVILPQTNMEGAQIIAERLRQAIAAAEMSYAGRVTASLGVATFPHHARSGDRLRVVADEFLYRAKRAGRNRIASPAETLIIDDDDEVLSEIGEIAAELKQ